RHATSVRHPGKKSPARQNLSLHAGPAEDLSPRNVHRRRPQAEAQGAEKLAVASGAFPAETWRVNVELVNTGSELMLGRVLNTHQQWLCRRLSDLGHVVTRQTAVADTGTAIQEAVREALSRADLVITTGGLGPTSDDITRELIAALLGRKLTRRDGVEAHIANFFARRGRPRPPKTEMETFVPE